MQGKTRLTRHVRFPRQSTYVWRMLPVGDPRTWQSFTSRQWSWAGPLLSRKGAPDTIHSTPADQSTGLYPVSLPSQPMKQWGQSQSSIDGRLLGLLGSSHQHTISTFNTCSRGPTHRSLTDTGRGYNLGGAGLPHTTPWPSQPVVSTFHLRAPPGIQFNQVPSTKPKYWVWEPMAATWCSDHPVIYRSLHLRLAIANDLSLAIWVTRTYRKVW
jgi:hypothetical protein